MTRAIHVARPSGHVAPITIDRPDARDAVGGAVTPGSATALESTAADDAVRVIENPPRCGAAAA